MTARPLGPLGSILEGLAAADVDCVIIGGVAAALHGAVRVTQDVDLLYDADPANRARLAAFLVAHHARPREGWPADVPFLVDAVVLDRCTILTLETDLGLVDVFREIPGVGAFAAAVAEAEVVSLPPYELLVLSVPALIRAKAATARPKDAEALLELRALADLQRVRRTTQSPAAPHPGDATPAIDLPT